MWFYTALVASVVSAISVILSKKILANVSPIILTWCTLVLATPAIAFFAVREGVPNFNVLFIVSITGSVLFYSTSKIIQFRAMKIADLSAIYPLTSLGPIFTLLIALLPPLNEKPGLVAIVGMLFALLGTYILNISNVKEGFLKPVQLLFNNKASALMIFSVFVGSIVIAFDKLAINNTQPQNTTFVLLTENIAIIIGLLPILYLRNKNFTQQVFDNKKLFLILGVLNAVSTILAFSAVGSGDIGIVSTILKTQLLFVLLLSFIFFRDKPRPETIAGSIIIVLGIVLIKIG
ncbi:MAG TPA: hypothetical protein ENK32_01980 [Anaerolineae bacterium]|nr:hypothetical protein [Anaerolineae bacterium]